MYFNNIINLILGLPKTLYLNFKYFKFKDAIKFPILVSKNVWLARVKGEIEIIGPVKFASILIGFGNVGIFDRPKIRSIWEVEGKIVVQDKAIFGYGAKLSVSKGAILRLGKNFKITANSTIYCNKSITFGDNCLLSWEILIMDTDSHKIKDINNCIINEDKEIKIGDNVWIGARSTILKGTTLGNNVIIGAGTLLSKAIDGNNLIIAGNPGKVVKRNITWEK